MLSWFKKKFTIKEDRPNEVALAPVQEKPAVRAGLAQRLRERLAKTRESLTARVDRLLLGRKVIDADLLNELEELLITADLGVATTRDLLDQARTMVARRELSDPAALKAVLQDAILAYLREAGQGAEMVQPATGPFVIMVVGVNGVGKTTTIGKIAHKFVQAGQKVLLVAADTFRARPSSSCRSGDSAPGLRWWPGNRAPTLLPWFTRPWSRPWSKALTWSWSIPPAACTPR